jgi:monoamine oxidase
MMGKGGPMLETAIIGGGLCGLALARSLHQQGQDFALYEARPRLGGRVLSTVCARSGLAIDLGPTWFWPDTQPLIARLVADLKLAHFPQRDEGALLHLRDPDKKPDVIEGQQVHNGARRLEGGMTRLVHGIIEELPCERINLGHALVRVQERVDHVLLVFRVDECLVEVEARRVALAVPPRLLEGQVGFKPDLDETIRHAMREAATWMAAQAKVVITYDEPHWRKSGQSGNAFVSHDQAVLGEIFDACDASASNAALGGFLAFSPELRKTFAVGLPMLMASQMAQVFGAALEKGEQHYQDWASEPYTCSALDLTSPATEHAGVANPLLRRPLWDGKLFLASSETAATGAGYLEGSLEAARRVQRALHRATLSAITAQPKPSAAHNTASLVWFSEWVAAQSDAALDSYRQRLNQSLTAQQREQLTQRALLGAVTEVFGKALEVLETLHFDTSGATIERGRSSLTPAVQKPFRDFLQTLLDDVIAFNRTSCALSNFPDEHQPSKEYVQTMLRDIAAAWQEFSLSANALLLSKHANTLERPSRGDGVTTH